MSPELKALGIDRLSVAERIQLVEDIWDTIATETADLPLTEAQRVDLERRLAEHRANPQAGSTWEEVLNRVRGRK
jgi:putative addiction module component (TIGR02574 family)